MSVTLHQLLTSQYGLKTSENINPLVDSVAVAVTKICSFNPNRMGLVIVNTGSANIYVSPSGTVAVGKGTLLTSGGGSMSFVWDEDFELVAHDFYSIADGAPSTIYLMEIVSI